MSTLYQIVDETDQIIGYKLRHEIDFLHDYYRIAVLWLTNSQNEVLIAQRLITKDKDPGKWGPAVGGTLEKGEDYDTNIYKEAEEEIGLTGIPFTKSVKLKLETPRKAFCQLYTGVCDKPARDFTPQPEEVEKVAWVKLDELKKDLANNPSKYVPSLRTIIDAVA